MPPRIDGVIVPFFANKIKPLSSARDGQKGQELPSGPWRGKRSCPKHCPVVFGGNGGNAVITWFPAQITNQAGRGSPPSGPYFSARFDKAVLHYLGFRAIIDRKTKFHSCWQECLCRICSCHFLLGGICFSHCVGLHCPVFLFCPAPQRAELPPLVGAGGKICEGEYPQQDAESKTC